MNYKQFRHCIFIIFLFLFICKSANSNTIIRAEFRSNADRSFSGTLAVNNAENGYFDGNQNGVFGYTGIKVITPYELRQDIPVTDYVNAVNVKSINNDAVLHLVGRKYGKRFELPVSLYYELVRVWAPEASRLNPLGNCTFTASNNGDVTNLENIPNGVINTDCTSYTIVFSKPNPGTVPVYYSRHYFSWGGRPISDILYEKRLPADVYYGTAVIHTTRIQFLNGTVPVKVHDVNFELQFQYTNESYIQEISIPSNNVKFNVVSQDESGGVRGDAQMMATVSGFFGSGLRVTPKVRNSPLGNLINIEDADDIIPYDVNVTSNITNEKYNIVDGNKKSLSSATFKTINLLDRYDMLLLFDFSFLTKKNNTKASTYNEALTLVFESDVL
ncbi:TPA: hypothetical protein MND73_004648 [Salmonella enterica subsp. houtenae]|nr:hypothetical protein [Salmonella enterica subsp. houtenae]